MSFKVNLGKDGHKQMRLLFQCEIGPEVPQQGSLTFCPSQHAFKIGKPRISSLHITSLTLSSKMYFIGSQVYMMAVYNVHYKHVRKSVRRSYPNRGAPKTERTNRWSKSGETTDGFTTACLTLHLVHGTARHANTFCRKTTHTSAHPANTSNVLRVPAQN